MGLAKLAEITRALVRHGRAADTPVAVIRAGTTREQATVTGTLADIATRVRVAGLEPPAVIVVGEVVRLRRRLAWFERSRQHQPPRYARRT
jgi:uroporphyrinogen III methyltransferase/synthase